MDHPIPTDILRWIVFLPLIGAIINGLLGAIIQKKMGKGAISFIACTPVVIAFGISLSVFFQLKGLNPEQRFLIDNLYSWITLGSLKVDMAFFGGSTFHRDDPSGNGHRRSDPYLCHRLHA